MRTETHRIAKSFADLQHGNCWIGTNFKDTLHGVNAEKAAMKLVKSNNSIWQLVSHIIYWRTTVVNRITGSLNPPPFSDFRLPETLDETSWKQTLLDFESSYHILRNAINEFTDEKLDMPSPKEDQTYYQLLQGCLQHDAYHLGQISFLKTAL